MPTLKRIKVQRINPNQLFVTWLEEWRDEAIARNSGLECHFSIALETLKKYPLPLKSGTDCLLLKHFGKKLCTLIDLRLEQHRAAGQPGHELHSAEKILQINVKNSEQKENRNLKSYDDEALMGRPCSSKNEGIALVNKCSINKSTNVSSKKVQIESATLVRPSKFSLIPRSFNIILLIDTQEVKGKVKDDVVSQLTREKINFEIRHLHVGDFLWIAQCRRTRQELVLPYIIERKRIDDFAASMKDGRYGEQKFRLKKSGIPNIVYMIEQLPHGTTNNSIPEANILQAAVNSIIHHGFFVKDTSSHRDSLLYLATFTKNLVELFKDKLLIQCDKNSLPDKINFDAEEISLMDFKQFNESSMKLRALDVQQMFMKQLLPIRGLAPEGILTILQYYKSPMALKKALDDAGPGAVALLTSLQSVRTKRRLGPILAKKIYQFYTQGFLR